MKKRLIYASMVLLVLGVVWMWFAPRIRVDLAARQYNPLELTLNPCLPASKSYKWLPNGIEVGLIHLRDGTVVKYWFVSKHVQPGLGTTRFDSVDGKTVYLHGCYCCEVVMTGFENWDELVAYIAEWDGSPS